MFRLSKTSSSFVEHRIRFNNEIPESVQIECVFRSTKSL